MRTANIDMDYVIHNVCAAAEYGIDPEDVVLDEVFHSIEVVTANIVEAAECQRRELFITKGNFRHFVIGDYKANRKDTWRPQCLKDARDYAEIFMGAQFEQGLEADDLLSLAQTKDTVLCTVDKDLDQVDGNHLLLKTQHHDYKLYTVEDGWKKFYHQLLIGDSTDNIIGCGQKIEAVWKSGAKAGQSYMKRKGIGNTAAIKLLDGLTEAECKEVCRKEYEKLHGDKWKFKMEQQARLVYMIKEFNDGFARMWTYDDSSVWMNPATGEIRMEG